MKLKTLPEAMEITIIISLSVYWFVARCVARIWYLAGDMSNCCGQMIVKTLFWFFFVSFQALNSNTRYTKHGTFFIYQEQFCLQNLTIGYKGLMKNTKTDLNIFFKCKILVSL